MNKKSKKDVLKNSIKKFLKDERGEFGVKQIAYTVAVIVVVGLVLAILRDQMEGIVTTIWNFLWEKIQDLMG
ncbi:MAG TPA: hypothetical protein DEF39_09960 [Hungateiclostridium thermocellum]|jgi:Flp pilus assembly pilin Flp|uniref:Uncharacterized protein n=2 Tax=Acetivibrio thermocellus TaxID=1515 RepID=G2JC70_ACET2|nr:hypothetical protein [Acetivibrio thermocellus]CDG35323.1 hypothetical protein CTHBC1_0659 [Acetivibrio thermocellus BC1]ADU74657.1 hypothetical protein Clo1313_1596 [Acetivibrio thermocellus DSM 1313]AEO12392.1 hypothetical protein Cthe_3321 [Acetivibrio thermocellus ATCC 27405]ALX08600.1 hypothetical protein AD2_01607 [Acetivibrio thermocellus AD2]ANV76349.1 hypothetical protein LQRI_1608 [Acetivibrio thermocellus DSM 2360]